MFGSEEILAFIRRSVGVRGDVADTAGSLHSKVKKLSDDTLAAIAKAPWNGKSLTFTAGYNYGTKTGDSIYHDYVRITGPRILLGGFVNVLVNPQYAYTRLTIDDQQILYVPSQNLDPYYTWDSVQGRLPIGYSKFAVHDDSAGNTDWYSLSIGQQDTSPGSSDGGEPVVFPFMIPILSSLVFEYQVSSGHNVATGGLWGLYHVAM